MTASDHGIWVGVDLGTQSVRVVAVTGDGEVLATGTSSLRSERAEERHEQSPAEWWNALGAASRLAMQGIAAKHCIRGIAVCGTSGTVLLVDEDGRALSPGLMYDDARATNECARANERGDALWQRLGYSRIQTVWGLPKWMWLAQHRREQRRSFFAHQADFITGCLAGRRTAADLSNSLKTGCDTIEGVWNIDLMASLGLQPEQLPPLTRAGTRIAEVCRVAAEHTGIPLGTPIIAGMTDGCASQLASGAIEKGSWNSVLGTTLVLKGNSPDLIRDPRGIVYSHRSPDGAWLPGGASSAGAGAFARVLRPEADLAALCDAALKHTTPPDIVYPLASQRGERFPFIALDATLTVPDAVKADDLRACRALCFGLAAVERLCFDYLHHTGFRIDGLVSLTGGGSRGHALNVLRASMLNRELVLPVIAEPALGMALLASTSERPLAEASRRMVRIAHRIIPDTGLRARAEDYYAAFLRDLQAKGWIANTIVLETGKRAAG